MAIGQVPGNHNDEFGDDDAVFADINITPLTDIFLVLLIIFMVTSSVIVNAGAGTKAGIKVNLPTGGTTDIKAQVTDLSVAILSDGRIVMGGDVMDAQELQQNLEKAHEKNPKALVIVQADEGVPHGKVVEVMEIAKAAGLSQLAIGIRKKEYE